MTPESFLRPFGGLDPGVSRHDRATLGGSSHCPRTESLRDMVLWLMTCEATGEAAGPRSLSFRPLSKLDAAVSRHERHWMRVDVIRELWNTGLE